MPIQVTIIINHTMANNIKILTEVQVTTILVTNTIKCDKYGQSKSIIKVYINGYCFNDYIWQPHGSFST